MGRVAGTYGVRGWIRVDAAQDALADCGTWWIGGVSFPVEQVKEHSGTLLAGHYYLADLVGLEVVNERGEALGVVQRWVFNGAQDVMEVAGDGKVRLLPWTPGVVKKVDLQRKQIDVEWGADW